jgi:hypothetical protein
MGIAIVIAVLCLSLWGIWSLYASDSPPVGHTEPPDLANFTPPSDLEDERPAPNSSSSEQA